MKMVFTDSTTFAFPNLATSNTAITATIPMAIRKGRHPQDCDVSSLIDVLISYNFSHANETGKFLIITGYVGYGTSYVVGPPANGVQVYFRKHSLMTNHASPLTLQNSAAPVSGIERLTVVPPVTALAATYSDSFMNASLYPWDYLYLSVAPTYTVGSIQVVVRGYSI